MQLHASRFQCALAFGLCLAVVTPAPAQTTGAAAVTASAAPIAQPLLSRDAAGHATIRATRLETPLGIDGRLDEEVYQLVPAMTDFIQQEPHEGLPATEKTEAWIFFDEKNVYLGVRCWDSQPDRIVANELRRDHVNIFMGDNVTLTIDTFDDRRTGFFFETNPLGAVREGLVTAEGVVSMDWNTVWTVNGGRFEQGWTAEMAIPFKSIRYSEGREQRWNLNVRRILPSRNETTLLNPVPPSYGTFGVAFFSSAATLIGIEPPAKSRNLEIKPYAISDVTTNREVRPQVSNDLNGDVGVDVKYGLSRSLIFDGTYNTDFAQVEADEQQINLTRFSLLFPEKREFFLEGGGIFSFGKTGEDTPVLFFSRRIGLNDGRPVPIGGGGRLTGKVGNY